MIETQSRSCEGWFQYWHADEWSLWEPPRPFGPPLLFQQPVQVIRGWTQTDWLK